MRTPSLERLNRGGYLPASEISSITGLSRRAVARACETSSRTGKAFKDSGGKWLLHTSVAKDVMDILLGK